MFWHLSIQQFPHLLVRSCWWAFDLCFMNFIDNIIFIFFLQNLFRQVLIVVFFSRWGSWDLQVLVICVNSIVKLFKFVLKHQNLLNLNYYIPSHWIYAAPENVYTCTETQTKKKKCLKKEISFMNSAREKVEWDLAISPGWPRFFTGKGKELETRTKTLP